MKKMSIESAEREQRGRSRLRELKDEKVTPRAAAEDENNVSAKPRRAVTSEPALHNLTLPATAVPWTISYIYIMAVDGGVCPWGVFRLPIPFPCSHCREPLFSSFSRLFLVTSSNTRAKLPIGRFRA